MSIEHHRDGKKCDHCDAPATPYTYRGIRLTGLVPVEGDLICSGCADQYLNKKFQEYSEIAATTPIAGAYRYRSWCSVCKRPECANTTGKAKFGPCLPRPRPAPRRKQQDPPRPDRAA